MSLDVKLFNLHLYSQRDKPDFKICDITNDSRRSGDTTTERIYLFHEAERNNCLWNHRPILVEKLFLLRKISINFFFKVMQGSLLRLRFHPFFNIRLHYINIINNSNHSCVKIDCRINYTCACRSD